MLVFKRKEEKRKLGCLVKHWPGRGSLGSVLVGHQPKFTLSYVSDNSQICKGVSAARTISKDYDYCIMYLLLIFTISIANEFMLSFSLCH